MICSIVRQNASGTSTLRAAAFSLASDSCIAPATIALTAGRRRTSWIAAARRSAPPVAAARSNAASRSNASARHSGSGNALGWFSFDGVAEVDEVRIVAGGGKPYRETEVAALPVKLSWTGQPHPPLARAQWVADLQAETARAWRAERAAENAKPPNPLDGMFMSGFMLLVLALLLGSVAAPLWGLWKWRGGWRVLPAVPLALMGFVIGRIVVDVARDPTSHNLWPFEILMFGAASVGVMLVLAFVRRLTGAVSSSA